LLGGTFPIDASRSRGAVETLAQRLGLSVEATAAGIVTLIDDAMAKVLRIVTVERGEDPRTFSLVAYGGGGPLHACALARELGIARVIVPAHPGIFAAQGLLVADVAAHFVQPLLCDVDSASLGELERTFASLEDRGRSELLEQGVDPETIAFRRTYDARYAGQSFELSIPHGDSLVDVATSFHRAHRARYGYNVPDERIELVNARLNASGTLPGGGKPSPRARQAACVDRRAVRRRSHSSARVARGGGDHRRSGNRRAVRYDDVRS
ncbi:MAG TPA: hydantoinase/oxoprolinase family protein, partial [Candidatus Baltobacteraceae bacterium]|nr:hydantoinase/oxoprolinase family protein [Candidatus Baltobacteraceae bacterium]